VIYRTYFIGIKIIINIIINNCVGSIDGKHCQINFPSHSGSSNINYLKYFSFVLQGVTDPVPTSTPAEGASPNRSDPVICYNIGCHYILMNTIQNQEFSSPGSSASSRVTGSSDGKFSDCGACQMRVTVIVIVITLNLAHSGSQIYRLSVN